MRYVPDHYDLFECLGGECEHSCCLGGWEVDIDEETYRKYQEIKGNLGDRLRHETEDVEEDGEVFHTFRLRHDTCPFFNEEGLCDIQKSEGEKALCTICREFPRYTIPFGRDEERTLTLSCEEAARLLFTKQDKDTMVPYEGPEYEEGDSFAETDEGEELLSPSDLEIIRRRAIALLQDRWLTIDERIIRYLAYCRELQAKINAGESDLTGEVRADREELPSEKQEAEADAPLPADFDFSGLFSGSLGSSAFDTASVPEEEQENDEAEAPTLLRFREMTFDMAPVTEEEMKTYYDERLAILETMEVLGEEWQTLLDQLKRWDGGIFHEGKRLSPLRRFMRDKTCSLEREMAWEHLMVYYTVRYFPRALYDGDLLGKAEFAVFLLMCLRDIELLTYLKNSEERKDRPAKEWWTLSDRIEVVRIFTRQVEHSDGNVEAIFEELLFADCGRAEALIRQVRH